jgi:hypothetical protein
MGLKADIVKALRVSLDEEDSEHLATEIMDRLPPVYAAAPEMQIALTACHTALGAHVLKDGKRGQDLDAVTLAWKAISLAVGETP